MFSRVLVGNRGEVAVRVIRALHEQGIEAVAVYSTADRDSLHVALADRAVCIGPPTAAQSYLKIPALIGAAATTGCEAVHPGWGFLAENAAFARACAENDLVFIGPTPETLARMGDKSAAKREMAAAGLPLVPGTARPATLDEARTAAAEAGYPVLLKAAAGGGGKGMRLVGGPDDLQRAYSTAAAEAEAAFGDASLYVEKAISPARHVEIQVLADAEGNVLTLGERECSIQRRHQKLIEESPSAALTPKLREEMESAAEIACDAIAYRNAGTFEFLVGPDGSFYFIELNARLQVEHPVSELCTGIDLVREQLRVAAGESLMLTGRAPRRGHAIELRINAEDPTRDFMPSPGRLERFRPPLGPGVRVDSSVSEGSSIPPFYDSLLAKLIVWDVDRPAAIARALRALTEFDVAGVPTTIAPVCRRSRGPPDGRAAGGQAGRADDALPLGRRGRAAGGAGGRGDRFLLDRDRGGRGGPRRGARPPHRRGGDRMDGRQNGRGRAERAADGHLRARERLGAAGGRDQRGGEAGAALRVERGRQVRQRDPRPDRQGACRVRRRARCLFQAVRALPVRLSEMTARDADRWQETP